MTLDIFSYGQPDKEMVMLPIEVWLLNAVCNVSLKDIGSCERIAVAYGDKVLEIFADFDYENLVDLDDDKIPRVLVRTIVKYIDEFSLEKWEKFGKIFRGKGIERIVGFSFNLTMSIHNLSPVFFDENLVFFDENGLQIKCRVHWNGGFRFKNSGDTIPS